MSATATPDGDGFWGRLWAQAELRPRLAILLVCLVAVLPGFFTTPPLDRDESRYAQASRQMIETGDYIEIRFQDEARNKKPAGIYWMQTVTARLFGGAADAPIWAYRIPSLLGAIGAALMTWWAGCALFGRRAGLLGGLLLAASLSAVVEGHIAKTDAMLLFTVVAAQAVMARAYLSARRGEAGPGWGLTALFWAAQGLGILVKGPITPMVSGLTFLMLAIWDRDAKWALRLRPLSGVGIAALIAAPWLIAIGIATGGAFFAEAVGNDMGGKLISSQERHGGIPGYHLLLLSVMFWPAALYVWPALRNAFAERKDDAVRFCIAWALPTWIVFELTPTKLPHYVLPAYPAIALLVAAFLLGAGTHQYPIWRRVGAALFALVTIALALAAVIVPAVYGSGPLWLAAPISLLIICAALFLGYRAWQGATVRTALQGIALGLATMALVFQVTLPSLTDLALSPRLAAAVERHAGPGEPATVSSGFAEPSLVFLLGTDTILAPPEAAAEHLAAAPGAVALITQHQQDRFLARAAELGLALDVREVVEGFNYSGGDPLTISVYRATGEAE
jgi:4-amino-4-deoxy-L-arabinose transferase-like glycosyltransferase